MHRIPWRPILLAALFATLAGCAGSRSCGGNKDYLESVERPRLQLPPELPLSERMAPLAIPAPAPDAARLDPEPQCIDEPPPYYVRKGAVADSAEDMVKTWAIAWSERRTDAVLQMYSTQFQAPGEAGAVGFIEQRRGQIATGRTPEAQLDELTVTAQGPDRRVARFVQRFGDDAVRKELTLARENGSWRIVAERTLEVL